MNHKRIITLDLGECSGCQACVELSSRCFGRDENMDKPVLVQCEVTDEEALELISYCPQDCIAFDGGENSEQV